MKQARQDQNDCRDVEDVSEDPHWVEEGLGGGYKGPRSSCQHKERKEGHRNPYSRHESVPTTVTRPKTLSSTEKPGRIPDLDLQGVDANVETLQFEVTTCKHRDLSLASTQLYKLELIAYILLHVC